MSYCPCQTPFGDKKTAYLNSYNLSQKLFAQEIIKEYPGLTEEDVLAALRYAAAQV